MHIAQYSSGSDSSVLERRVSNRKVADLRSIPELAMCRRRWERHLTLISHCWSQAVSELWWPSLTKDWQTEPRKVLCVGMVQPTR